MIDKNWVLDISLDDNQILVTKCGQWKNYGDQHDRRFQPRDMITIKCNCSEEFDQTSKIHWKFTEHKWDDRNVEVCSSCKCD